MQSNHKRKEIHINKVTKV